MYHAVIFKIYCMLTNILYYIILYYIISYYTNEYEYEWYGDGDDNP